MKRITRCKLALIFESANHRKFFSLFGSKAARPSTSNEDTLEGYAIKHVFDHCDSIMKNVINKKTKMKRQWFINDLLLLYIKKYVKVSLYFKLITVFMADRKLICNFSHTVIMSSFSLKG